MESWRKVTRNNFTDCFATFQLCGGKRNNRKFQANRNNFRNREQFQRLFSTQMYRCTRSRDSTARIDFLLVILSPNCTLEHSSLATVVRRINTGQLILLLDIRNLRRTRTLSIAHFHFTDAQTTRSSNADLMNRVSNDYWNAIWNPNTDVTSIRLYVYTVYVARYCKGSSNAEFLTTPVILWRLNVFLHWLRFLQDFSNMSLFYDKLMTTLQLIPFKRSVRRVFEVWGTCPWTSARKVYANWYTLEIPSVHQR